MLSQKIPRLYSGMDADQGRNFLKKSYIPLDPMMYADLVYLVNFPNPTVKQKKCTLISWKNGFLQKIKSFLHLLKL